MRFTNVSLSRDEYLQIDGYFTMANSQLEDNILEEVKRNYPEAIMVKAGIHKYIISNKEGKKKLTAKLECEKQNLDEQLQQVKYTLKQLNLGGID